jgi:hypothetical protein
MTKITHWTEKIKDKPTEILEANFLEMLANVQYTQRSVDQLFSTIPNDIHGQLLVEYHSQLSGLAPMALEILQRKAEIEAIHKMQIWERDVKLAVSRNKNQNFKAMQA